MFLPPEVVFFPTTEDQHSAKAIVAMNIFSRTCLGLTGEALAYLLEPEHNIKRTTFEVWDIQRFGLFDGLLADPTTFIRSPDKWPQATLCSPAELRQKCLDHFILVENWDDYRQRFSRKKSLLDWTHFGNLHEQLGQQLITKARIQPETWWVNQKFSDDRGSIRNNLYRAVQEEFLNSYFKRKLSPGMRVLDIGCGTGYYAKKMAAQGAMVTGVDPSMGFLEEAGKTLTQGATFIHGIPGTPDGLAAIPTASIDFAFMSDALLYYFHPINPAQKPSLRDLFDDIKRVLKPSGIFASLEPHCVFFQQPWLGMHEFPYTVISEYTRKNYGIVPTFGELLGAFCKNGLSIVHFEEIYPAEYYRDVDPRGYGFAREFPLWHLIEAKL